MQRCDHGISKQRNKRKCGLHFCFLSGSGSLGRFEFYNFHSIYLLLEPTCRSNFMDSMCSDTILD